MPSRKGKKTIDEVEIRVRRLPSGAGLPLPSYQTPGSSGLDLHAAVESVLTLEPFDRAMVPTGIAIELPRGVEAQIRPRSGLASGHGIALLNSPGTVDSDYRGEVMLVLINLGREKFVLRRGDRVGQLVVSRVCKAAFVEAGSLGETERGNGGFGHTGV